MYCPNCGTALTDDAIFCIKCGKRVPDDSAQSVPAPTEQPAQTYHEQKYEVRKNELSTLNNLIEYFSQKQASYDRYDEACAMLNRLSRGASNALLIWGGIVLGIFIITILCVFSDPTDLFTEIFVSVVFLLLPGGAMLTGGILKKTRHRHLYYQYQYQYIELSQGLHQHFFDYPDCPIPPECTNPRILAKLQQIIVSGRSDTIKQGLNNLFASSNHRGLAQYQEILKRNTADCNWRKGLKFIFLPPRYFK
jgi:uncharacterized Zn finger protein (UPF0148 family)